MPKKSMAVTIGTETESKWVYGPHKRIWEWTSCRGEAVDDGKQRVFSRWMSRYLSSECLMSVLQPCIDDTMTSAGFSTTRFATRWLWHTYFCASEIEAKPDGHLSLIFQRVAHTIPEVHIPRTQCHVLLFPLSSNCPKYVKKVLGEGVVKNNALYAVASHHILSDVDLMASMRESAQVTRS